MMYKRPFRPRVLTEREKKLLQALLALPEPCTKLALSCWQVTKDARLDDLTVGMRALDRLYEDGYITLKDGYVEIDAEQRTALAMLEENIGTVHTEVLRAMFRHGRPVRPSDLIQYIYWRHLERCLTPYWLATLKSRGAAYILGAKLRELYQCKWVSKIGDRYYLSEGQRVALLHRFPSWPTAPPDEPDVPDEPIDARAGRAVELE